MGALEIVLLIAGIIGVIVGIVSLFKSAVVRGIGTILAGAGVLLFSFTNTTTQWIGVIVTLVGFILLYPLGKKKA